MFHPHASFPAATSSASEDFGFRPVAAGAVATAERSRAEAAQGKARSCIVIWLDGGPSHLETFDLKPDASAEVRGPFAAIPTSVSAIRICEHMPKLAERMEHAAIIRSMTSPLGNTTWEALSAHRICSDAGD